MAEVLRESDLKRTLRTSLCAQIEAVRQRRRYIEDTWLANRRTWMNIALEQRFVSSSGNRYSIPSARRTIERTVNRAIEMVIPDAAKNFDIAPGTLVSQKNLGNVDGFMRHVLKTKIKIRTNIAQLVRCSMLYGKPTLKTAVTVINNQVWPTQRPVDPFAFYTFPETVVNIEDAELVFEDYLFSFERYKTLVSKSRRSSDNRGFDDISISDLTKPDWPYHLTERLAYQGITDPTQNVANLIEQTGDKLRKTASGFVSLTELWIKREDVLFQVYIAWNLVNGPRIVAFLQSEYDEPLYRTINVRALPGESYTNAPIEDITALEVLSNDQLNKFQDAVDWEQGFIAVNVNGKRHDSWKAKGRAIWEFQENPRDALNLVQPPITSTNQLRAWQIYLGMMNSMGGAGTIAEGQPGRNMPRAGGAVNNLINLGMADVTDIAKNVESVLTLGLADIYKAVKLIPEDQVMLIPGVEVTYGQTKSSAVTKANLVGRYDFEWIGSVQYQEESTRSQRVMIFLNMLTQPLMLQMIGQQGYAPDMVELIQMTWRYVLGERGLSKILIPISQFQQQAQAMQGGMQPQPQGRQQLSQNGNTEPQPQGPQPNPKGAMPALNHTLPTVTSGFMHN